MVQGKNWTEAQRNSRLGHLLQRNRQGHTGRFLYEDADWMRDAYVVRDLSLRQMAIEAECGLRTIARWMQLHQIPTDPTKIGRRMRWYGPDMNSWRGDDIKYTAAHLRVTTAKGGSAKQFDCDHCGMPAHEWAYDHSDPTERRDPEGDRAGYPFSLDPENYMPLCVPCHRRFDRRAAALREVDDVAGKDPAA
jgi:hypothetical protein